MREKRGLSGGEGFEHVTTVFDIKVSSLFEQITNRFLLLSGHEYSTGFHGRGQEVRTTNGVQRRSRLRDVQGSEASLGELKSIYSTHIGFPTLAEWQR